MKQLEELGISPTPWILDDNEGVASDKGYWLTVKDISKADAHLIVAAPKLYGALYDVVSYCESTHLVPSERFGKVLMQARAALAEASGESEVKN